MTTDRSEPTKALATRTAPELASHVEPVLMHDSSTNTLIRHYRRIKAGPGSRTPS